AGKSSLFQHLVYIWIKRAGAKKPTPVPVDIPIHAFKGPEMLAQAIGSGLPVSLFDKAKGLLEAVNGMSVMGTGLSFERSSLSSPGNLQFPRTRAVVLMIDEAQNLDLSSPFTPPAELLLWLHQGNHGLPLVPVLAGLANLEGRLARAGISRLSNDAVLTLGCLSRDESCRSASLFFDFFGIPHSDSRNDWTEILYDLSEGWPVHLHHGFRALSGSLADANLRLEAVDGGAFRREEARLRAAYYDARTDLLPIQLIARALERVGASGTRNQYTDAIDAEHDSRRGGRDFRIPDGMDAEGLFETMVGKGLLQRVKHKRYCATVPSLRSYIAAHSGSVLHPLSLEGDVSGIKSALAEGEDPNIVDIRGRTPLHIATECGWTEIAETLLGAGANAEAVDRKGRRAWELLPRHATMKLKKILMPMNVPDYSLFPRDQDSLKPKNGDEPSFDM
ncbi:MAG: hypothetical protein OXN84_15390, partial [Albidovulum sp.]|nr:hypothetical protein [Albidovulum sp.]